MIRTKKLTNKIYNSPYGLVTGEKHYLQLKKQAMEEADKFEEYFIDCYKRFMLNIKSFLKELEHVLIRQVGDTRICPKCCKSIIIKDRTSQEAMKMYNKVKTYHAEIKNAK